MALALGLVALPSIAAPPAAPGSAAELRNKVDAAAAALEDTRATTREELSALRVERADLQRQIRAESARAKTLGTLQREATERAEQRDAEAQRLHAPTVSALAIARDYVNRTLPFARSDRLATVDAIERDLAAATPDYGRALERILRFIEEEDAMGSEIAVTQQALELDGERQVVDVIRLGMALMYIRTQDGRFGWSFPTSDGWTTELVDGALADIIGRRFVARDANDALGPADLVVPAIAVEAPPS